MSPAAGRLLGLQWAPHAGVCTDLQAGTQPSAHGTQNATGAGRVQQYCHSNGIMSLKADDAADLSELPPEALLLSLRSVT